MADFTEQQLESLGELLNRKFREQKELLLA